MHRQDTDKPLILLVDDMPTNLHVMAAALKAHYRLKVATSGESGLTLARSHDQPELILLDVMMPGMSGIEMLKHLRADDSTREIPVIFVSADASEQSQLNGFELGADDYLAKPIVSSVLLARVRNVLERKRIEAQLRLAAHVFEHSGEALMITDYDNRIVEVNPAFTRLTGYTAEEVHGRDPSMLASGRTSAAEYQAIWRGIKEKGFWQGEIWDRHKDGSVWPKLLTISVVLGQDGSVDYHIASFADIRMQKAAEDRIRYIAYHDPLTDLPNRLYLKVALEQSIAKAHREHSQVALMFIDLDRFKVINDTLGHHIGDQLLVMVAHRLRESVRASDLVARLGGDEFVVVLTSMNAALDATPVAAKILQALNQIYQIDHHQLYSSPSIGISIFPDDGSDIDTLMKKADTAMYSAKEQGRNNAQFFDVAMGKIAGERLELERELRRALDTGQFELFYQPQIEAQSGKISGAEVLLRWRHPVRGLIMPDRFIPIAEEGNLIQSIGAWVLDEACRQLASWRTKNLTKMRIAVNLSALQLRSPLLAEEVKATLGRHGLTGDDLELEITESVAMHKPEQAIQLLHALRELGVRLAIDDFGTGYSSLAYLKLLPIQTLKLDQSFVRDIETDANDAAISAATLALAHSLGLMVVAEGVENESQRLFLIKHGCDLLQGNLIGKSEPARVWDRHWPPWPPLSP